MNEEQICSEVGQTGERRSKNPSIFGAPKTSRALKQGAGIALEGPCAKCGEAKIRIDSIGRIKCWGCVRLKKLRPNLFVQVSHSVSKLILDKYEREILVDSCIVGELKRFRWRLDISRNEKEYVATSHPLSKLLYLHRFVLNAPIGIDVDHKNGNGLDNRKENLRLVTMTQNQQNQKLSIANTVGFKGVHLRKDNGLYRARIVVSGKRFTLGHFETAKEAGAAYAQAAVKYFGEFARIV